MATTQSQQTAANSRVLEAARQDRLQKEAPPIRVSARESKGKRRKINNAKVKAFEDEYGEDATRSAIIDELTAWVDNHVFEPVFKHLLTDEQHRKILRSTLVLKAKFTPTGVFDMTKARIVAGGDQEDKTTFESLYSPTTSMEAAFAKRQRHHRDAHSCQPQPLRARPRVASTATPPKRGFPLYRGKNIRLEHSSAEALRPHPKEK